ncbi:MAG TPA: hypothetical protein VH583_02080 [Vicinamibacterales bacterium]|jgi:hypothetical protein
MSLLTYQSDQRAQTGQQPDDDHRGTQERNRLGPASIDPGERGYRIEEVAVKMPSECEINGLRATQRTSRGEYADALNCTVTKTSDKTIPVRTSIPEAIEEYTAVAALVLIPGGNS